MTPIISTKFFPQQFSNISTFFTLTVFAMGFLCRPIGGIFLGYFGDVYGRAITLRISILTITVSTMLIGMLPSYESIGILAPILFVVLRLIQGFSIGGEYSGIMIYLAESAPYKRRGFITSFAATGANLGFLLATLMCILLTLSFSEEMIKDWVWRLPFLFVGIPGAFIIYYRFKLTETTVYLRLKRFHLLKEHPLITAFKVAPLQLIKILGLTCMSSTFYYFFVGYIPTYLERYMGFSLKTGLFFQSMMLIGMLFVVPLGGLLGDYFSRKRIMILTSIAILFLIFPCIYLLQSKSLSLTALALAIATILSSLDQSNTLTAAVENCPENVRYSSIAFSYNLGNALFGGTTPVIVTLLIDNINSLAPSYYLFFMACISLVTATTLLNKNQSLAAI
ncbi:conserved membrane protein of unknown function [Legionella fallonii LLAP-10]|uniref:Major facilitator superfamily (MFS) profile domain-containing protein n=2 Tax=Legionella fallonii TaxID=96230 RepID=A0A098G2Q9_9GAMM|nr:conserved membrane protein of unknown function [Legionella fallonii LLAP-10]